MSSQNAFPGRPAARPATPTSNGQPSNGQPSWVHPQTQTGRPQQPANSWPPPQQPAPTYPNNPQTGYANQPPEQQQAWNQSGHDPYGQEGSRGQSDPYAPQFEPYVPPARPNYGQQPQAAPVYRQQQQPQAPQWPGRGIDPRGFDAGNYAAPEPVQPAPSFGQQQYHDTELSAADWAGPHDTFAHDPFQQNQGDPSLGFGQAEGGELEPVYGEEEGDYEYDDEPPRGRRPILILAALVGAIVIGGGMAYGYKKMTNGHNPQGDPPIIKSDDFASKTKPADAGGKQFPYSDTKIMGRLGDGTSTASADESNNSQQSPPPDHSANSPDASPADDGGARKVSTLVVGRDGTIQAPAAPADNQPPEPSSSPTGATGVPGTSLIDFGQQGGGGPAASAQAADDPPMRPRPVNAEVTTPAKKIKPVKVAKVNTINAAVASDSSADGSADTPPPSKKKFKRVARAEPTVETDATADAPPVVPSSSGGGAGFVAVLASVPHSTSSRIDALKRFADMQQKYSTALSGKTPDIASANLSKGAYDRLIVGPPGSREEASNVCSQLKAQGYKDCWVTSY